MARSRSILMAAVVASALTSLLWWGLSPSRDKAEAPSQGEATLVDLMFQMRLAKTPLELHTAAAELARRVEADPMLRLDIAKLFVEAVRRPVPDPPIRRILFVFPHPDDLWPHYPFQPDSRRVIDAVASASGLSRHDFLMMLLALMDSPTSSHDESEDASEAPDEIVRTKDAAARITLDGGLLFDLPGMITRMPQSFVLEPDSQATETMLWYVLRMGPGADRYPVFNTLLPRTDLPFRDQARVKNLGMRLYLDLWSVAQPAARISYPDEVRQSEALEGVRDAALADARFAVRELAMFDHWYPQYGAIRAMRDHPELYDLDVVASVEERAEHDIIRRAIQDLRSNRGLRRLR